MCSAVGGAVVVGTGSVSASMPVSAAEAAVAMARAAVPTVTSREEGDRVASQESQRSLAAPFLQNADVTSEHSYADTFLRIMSRDNISSAVRQED